MSYRHEQIVLKAFLTHESTQACRDNIIAVDDKYKKTLRFVAPGDEFNLTYNFSIEYFGECYERLEAFYRVMGKADATQVDMECLNHGESVLQKLVLKIQEIKQKHGAYS
jgi:hypothetical protein